MAPIVAPYTRDVRFPTSRTLDESDAMNPAPGRWANHARPYRDAAGLGATIADLDDSTPMDVRNGRSRSADGHGVHTSPPLPRVTGLARR